MRMKPFAAAAAIASVALVASPAGRLSDRIGSRGLATAGLLVLAVGVGGLSTVGADSSITVVMAWLAVMGLGTGIFISGGNNNWMAGNYIGTDATGTAPRGNGTSGIRLDSSADFNLVDRPRTSYVYADFDRVTGRIGKLLSHQMPVDTHIQKNLRCGGTVTPTSSQRVQYRFAAEFL